MFDVLIIGGGIVGCAIGRCLSQYAVKLGLLEKNVEVCQGTTKANSAIVHGGFDCVPGTLKAKLNVRGNAMMAQLSQELGFAYHEVGSLVLAFDAEDIAELNILMERGLNNGVADLQLIDPPAIHALEPRVSREVKKALYCPHSGVLDPFNFTYGMLENAMENGLELFTETEVTGLEKVSEGICVHTTQGDFTTRTLINAAGLGAEAIAAMAKEHDFRLTPTKGVYRLLDKTNGEEIHTVLFQTPTKRGKGVLVAPTYDGSTLVGPTATIADNADDTSVDAASLAMVDLLGRKSVPDLKLQQTIRVFTGVRAKPDTGDFMIYPSRTVPGLVHVGGIESPGLVSSPAIAEYVLDLLLHHGFAYAKKTHFQPKRHPFVRLRDVSLEEKKAMIQKNPRYGNIVCRCETISEGEIVDAIHRLGGARTVDGVKRRVRAGMGRCQGGFCLPRVLAILARECHVDPSTIRKEYRGSELITKHLKEQESPHATL